MRIAFIGLGIMGSRMAMNLQKKGAQLSVYNRTAAAADAVVAAGATRAASPEAAVASADLVFSMLSRPEVIDQISSQFLPAMAKNALWVDCSTVNPSFAQQMHARAGAHGIRYMDAPVAGTLPQAEQAQLVFFAGGSEADFQQVAPYLEQMGKTARHVGAVSRASAFKILVNSLLAQSMASFAETVVLGMRLGFDQQFLLETLSQGAVAAPFLQFKANRLQAAEYSAQFPLELMRKDLQLLAQTAYENQLSQPMAQTAANLYTDAEMADLGRADFSAVFKYLVEKVEP